MQAAEAYFLGLCDRLVDGPTAADPSEKWSAKELEIARERVLESATELAKGICEGGPIAIRLALKAVNDWEKGEESENSAYDGVVATRDRNEALRAFREKRRPVFEGR